MKRVICTLLAVVGLMACTVFIAGASAPTEGFSVRYRLFMQAEDRVRVETCVSGYTGTSMSFYADGMLGGYDDITGICSNLSVSDQSGKLIPWKWANTKSLAVTSGGKDFTLSYEVETWRLVQGELIGQINQFLGHEALVLFRNDGVFFTPDALFLLPSVEPASISLETSFPSGLDVYGSLPLANGVYTVEGDMWGDLRDDFCKSFFVGGNTVAHVSSEGETGNVYDFVVFDWHDDYDQWFATDLESAGKQFASVTDLFAKFYADQIGPLSPHRYVIADSIPSGTNQGFPPVATRVNWYNYMTLWPDNSMLPQVAHHVLHAYMFSNMSAKIHFANDGMFVEGLPTYLENIVPELLLGEDYYYGRLYALLMLDQRGHAYGIDQNQFHTRYNISALKTYLLDMEIRDRTAGRKDILDFVSALWGVAKDYTSVQNISEQQIERALSDVAGANIVPAYRAIRDTNDFRVEDFASLKESFRSYVKTMADEYFWGSEFLFLCYVDVCSIRGDYWPHYSLIEQNTIRDRRDALQPFRSSLEGLGKKAFSEDDVLRALASSTGKDHRGFFEFWRGMGFDADPADIPVLGTWDPGPDAPYTTNSIPSMTDVGRDQTIRVVLDKTPLAFDSGPLIRDGRTMVPIRTVVEALGGVVGWDPVESAVHLDFEGKTIKMKIDDPKVYVNGVEYVLDVAPFLSNDRTLVPVRFLSESIGCKVYWYDLVKTVVIEK